MTTLDVIHVRQQRLNRVCKGCVCASLWPLGCRAECANDCMTVTGRSVRPHTSGGRLEVLHCPVCRIEASQCCGCWPAAYAGVAVIPVPTTCMPARSFAAVIWTPRGWLQSLMPGRLLNGLLVCPEAAVIVSGTGKLSWCFIAGHQPPHRPPEGGPGHEPADAPGQARQPPQPQCWLLQAGTASVGKDAKAAAQPCLLGLRSPVQLAELVCKLNAQRAQVVNPARSRPSILNPHALGFGIHGRSCWVQCLRAWDCLWAF